MVITSFLPYGTEWKHQRKLIQSYIGSVSALRKIEVLETIEARKFLLNILEQPTAFIQHSRACVCIHIVNVKIKLSKANCQTCRGYYLTDCVWIYYRERRHWSSRLSSRGCIGKNALKGCWLWSMGRWLISFPYVLIHPLSDWRNYKLIQLSAIFA